MANILFGSMQVYARSTSDLSSFLERYQDTSVPDGDEFDFNSVVDVPEIAAPTNRSAILKAYDIIHGSEAALKPYYPFILLSSHFAKEKCPSLKAEKSEVDQLLKNYNHYGYVNQEDWERSFLVTYMWDATLHKRSAHRASIRFNSRWAPPQGVVQTLIAAHPNLSIWGSFSEPGNGFYGLWDKTGIFRTFNHGGTKAFV